MKNYFLNCILFLCPISKECYILNENQRYPRPLNVCQCHWSSTKRLFFFLLVWSSFWHVPPFFRFLWLVLGRSTFYKWRRHNDLFLWRNLFVYFSSMLNITSNSYKLVDKLNIISNLTDWLVLDKVCELSTSSSKISLSNTVENNIICFRAVCTERGSGWRVYPNFWKIC